jgi:hypothetical protein
LYFYQEKIYLLQTIKIDNIQESVLSYNDELMMSFKIPSKAMYYGYKSDDFITTRDIYEKDLISSLMFYELKHLFFFKTFYIINTQTNRTLLIGFILYSFIYIRFLIFVFSFFNK